MNKIKNQFNTSFKHWNILLPPDDIAQRKRGKIVKGGWAIWYLFGADENGEYLDYYASHRMTDDRHVRIYSNGKTENLPVIESMRLASMDPEEDARLEAEFFTENQRIAEMLEAKGFGLAGDEPGGVQINRVLHLEKFDDNEESN